MTKVPVRAPRPIWQHALLLLVLLAGVAAGIGTRSSFITDEAFVVIQVRQVQETGEWTLPHPLAEVDPTGAGFPLHGADRFEDGYVLYGRHPLLVQLYRPVYDLFGLAGLVGVSIVGTVGAAVGAALLASRIRPGSGPSALWITGVASPLFFDSFVIHAHTVGAGLAVLSVVLALRTYEGRGLLPAVGAVLGLLLTALLRTEGLLFAASVGLVFGALGLARRRLGLLVLGGAAVGAGAAAWLLDRAWATSIGGVRVPLGAFDTADVSFLSGRITSASYTLLVPGYRDSVAELLTVIGALLVITGAVLSRRRPEDRGGALFAALGATLLVVRTLLEWGPVPGLLIAFVVGVVGLVLVDGEVTAVPTTRIVGAVAATFGVAVLAVQYEVGGHTEWGGRYFALGVPLVAAVAAASLHRADAEWSAPRWRPVRISLVAAALALAVLAVVTLRGTHERNLRRTEGVLAAAAGLPGDDDRPVVVTEDDQIPRLARERYDDVRFLRATPGTVPDYLEALADVGVHDLVIVSVDPARTLERLPAGWVSVGEVEPHDLQWRDGGGIIRVRWTAGP